MNPSDERLWAMLVHIGDIFIGLWPALIGYLVLKDRGPFVREHTKTALNFQLTMLLVSVIAIPLCFVLVGFLILIGVAIVIIVFSIMAAIAAHDGRPYRYPLTISFIK